jgi:hypothetical protein
MGTGVFGERVAPDKVSAIEMERGPLMRMRARAETPGGVEQAAIVSFSKTTGRTEWQINTPLGESYLWG